jgi:hypothetical protein
MEANSTRCKAAAHLHQARKRDGWRGNTQDIDATMSDVHDIYISRTLVPLSYISPCLVPQNILQNISDSRHIESLDTCMKH